MFNNGSWQITQTNRKKASRAESAGKYNHSKMTVHINVTLVPV